MQETGCPPATSASRLRFDTIDFSRLPGQSKLFLQYQSDPLSLRNFYPTAVESHTEISSRVDEVLSHYQTDRERLTTILLEQNKRFGAAQETFRNIDLLRQAKTVAVMTGQQTGVLTGPLYTIYKALSAIQMVRCLRERGIDSVPIFWAATEDHDFEEISKASLIDASGASFNISLEADGKFAEQPVGTIEIPASFATALDAVRQNLPDTEFTREEIASLTNAWQAGSTIGEAFCRQLQQIFARYGLIVVDPHDPALKELATPIYRSAIERSDEIVKALVARSTELERSGYHAQVLVKPEYFPLFFHTDDGARRSVRKSGDAYRIVGTKTELSRDELLDIASREPQRFSPGVMLRPAVQDYLFPTVCYFGGGAEIAYFAQNSEVYRLLERPVTTILHRQSFTVVESKHARTLEKYELELTDLFEGFDALLPRVIDRFVNPTTSRLFADAEENINLELNRLDQELSRIDPTLAANLATRRRKILYHITALQTKFRRVQAERDETVNRRLRSAFSELLPFGQLQERQLNLLTFTSRHGSAFVSQLYESIDLDERGHRVIYL